MILRGGADIPNKKALKALFAIPIAVLALLYGGGYVAQFLYNYDVWQAAG